MRATLSCSSLRPTLGTSVRSMRSDRWRCALCQDIFRGTTETGDPIRVVLTKGVAGVGKTVLTQKFSLDWAEGRANQDVQLLFHFTFRDLNVLRKKRFSLVELIHHCFKESKKLFSFQCLQLLFIFDGLDECRFRLDFSRSQVLTEPTESASVEELLVNLIRGSLLPSARLWITTRPAAANQIPAQCVSMVTEVRGFTDPQKEQYFRKRFRDEATAVISHIKSSRSLYIMCSIPVFCWIISTVLQNVLKQTEKPELPKTLTEMYVHFLVVQAKVKNEKYHSRSLADLHWTPETREMVLSLGKLAFEQLLKGNLIFYERDLRKCGLDAAEIAHSGVFTEVFRDEQGLYEDKVYCFIHLTVQEFLAALHFHQTFYSSGVNLLSPPHSSESHDPEAFYCSAVDQALQSPNGHLDLFLRFLLGLSLPTSQRLLPSQMIHTESDSTNWKTIDYITEKLAEDSVSEERSLNLMHCLNELNYRSPMETIQEKMRGGRLCRTYMTPICWSALSFNLLSSNSDLEEFDLRKYWASERGLKKLLLVIKTSTKAILSGCRLSPGCCSLLASVLSSPSLTHLDLSNNDLQDSGVELLCEGLKSTPCRLETLSLSGCMVSETGGAFLASALSSAHSPMKELDLSYNHPGASAELLMALQAPLGPLQTLRLDPAGARWMTPGLMKYSCDFSLDPNTAHRRLLLSGHKRTVTRVEELQPFPHHEDRFTDHCQVLSSTGLWGRCYWEVEWSRSKGWVDVAVSYNGIKRRGDTEESGFGDNDQSWCLRIEETQQSVSHNKQVEVVSEIDKNSHRVGVFLDSEAGALSFYHVSSDECLFHLYTYFTSFTEPVFPGFGLWDDGSSVSVVKVKTGGRKRPLEDCPIFNLPKRS
uniref:Uncharacterized protein n=1 Tax=Neogobius melanostomus TaxID=47308 RepID=A0A8C6SQ52_9GOBI